MGYKAAVLTISDKGFRGERVDTSGPALREMLMQAGYEVVHAAILPDERGQIAEALKQLAEAGVALVLTTGGTGFSPRDITPEATLDVIERQTPGLAETMRAESMRVTPRGCLSRGVAGIRNRTLIVNLPGSERAARENLTDIAGVRVVCSFVEDIYKLAENFLAQDDITLLKRKDYIENPKPSGYRSLHLLVKTPIYTETGKKEMIVEVQMRTIAMDFWASLEHKLRYKKAIDPQVAAQLAQELETCAEESARLDEKMLRIRDRIKMD